MRILLIVTAALSVFLSTSSHALVLPITGGSLHGSTGSLEITQASATQLDVTWSLDTSNFNDDGNHTYLTHAGFKIAGTMGSATFSAAAPAVTGTVFDTNVSNNGCASGGQSGFICFELDAPYYDAVAGSLLEIDFTYMLNSAFDLASIGGVSFAGKYGLGNGWVISESASDSSTVPVPGALFLFGSGLLGLGLVRRRYSRG